MGARSSEIRRQEEEKAYQQFLEEEGHIDFSLLSFLPAIKTDDQLEAYERVRNAQGTRIQRAKQIFQGKVLDEEKAIDPDAKKKKKAKKDTKKGKKGAKEKDLALDQEIQEDIEFLAETELPEDKRILAQRFDFDFLSPAKIKNIKVDEKGVKLSSNSNELATVVAKRGIYWKQKEPTVEEEKEVDINNLAQESEKETDDTFARLRAQLNKYYFQFRIDELPEGNRHPRIVVGVCNSSFDINKELSRQTDAWCFTFYSGDKFTGKRWKNYYDTDEQDHIKEPPKYGFFQVGSVVGLLIDLDRGIINLYKDGNDLG